jgi:hypothetical protein
MRLSRHSVSSGAIEEVFGARVAAAHQSLEFPAFQELQHWLDPVHKLSTTDVASGTLW